MRKQLATQFQPRTEGVFHKKSTVRKIAVAGLRNDSTAATAVNKPFADILLQPDGKLEPGFANAKSLLRVARGHFEHGERADLRDLPGLFEKRDFGAQFGVRQAEFGGPAAAG